jgi:hypothetical protein
MMDILKNEKFWIGAAAGALLLIIDPFGLGTKVRSTLSFLPKVG